MIRGNRSIWSCFLVLVCLQLCVALQLRGPAPQPADCPTTEFSATRAYAVLARLLGDQSPHPVGSAANQVVRARLLDEFERLGLDVEIVPMARPPYELVNILARLPNSTNPGRPLVLATHYDSVPAGPGAADAGACVAALLETARILSAGGPYERPVYFLLTDGEEAGMWGAEGFVESHSLAREKPVVLNFEARGTSGPSIMFETHRNNLAATRILADHLPRPCVTGSSFVTVYRFLPNDTDFTIFARDGWAGLNFAFIGDAHNYHTANDTLENLSLRSLQHHGENALALARALAEDAQADMAASSEDAVFFDLLGCQVFVYPSSWALPLALVPLFVLMGRFARQYFSKTMWRDALWVAGAVCFVLLSTGTLGLLISRSLAAAGMFPRAFVAHGGWLVAIYVPLSMFLVWAAARLCLRAMADESVWILFWSGWSLAGVALAASVPGFSYFTLVPALGAAGCSLLPVRTGVRVVLTFTVSAIILLPLVNLLPVALGPLAAAVYHPAMALLWLPWLPLFADAKGIPVQPE